MLSLISCKQVQLLIIVNHCTQAIIIYNMLDSPIRHKTAKIVVDLTQKSEPAAEDSTIAEAYKKFEQLSSGYQVETKFSQHFEMDKASSFPRKRNGRVDNFTIMAQLRHLENVASISNAEHERSQRDKAKNRHSYKNQSRKAKSWMKLQSTLNQPYIKVYENIIKSKQNNQEGSGLLACQMQSDQQKISAEDQKALRSLNFSKELRPYKKIVAYTKERIRAKNEYMKKDKAAQRKAQSLQEFRGAHKDKVFYKNFSQLAKKQNIQHEKQKIKDQGRISSEQIVSIKMNRIFKKHQSDYSVEQLKSTGRFTKLISKQQNLISEQLSNDPNSDLKQMKNKFAQIILELNRTTRKSMDFKRMDRMSQSLDFKQKKYNW